MIAIKQKNKIKTLRSTYINGLLGNTTIKLNKMTRMQSNITK